MVLAVVVVLAIASLLWSASMVRAIDVIVPHLPTIMYSNLTALVVVGLGGYLLIRRLTIQHGHGL